MKLHFTSLALLIATTVVQAQQVVPRGGFPPGVTIPGMPPGFRPGMPGVPGTRSATPTTAQPARNTAAQPPLTSPPGGMALNPNWLPSKFETKRELIESLDFYASAAVGNAPRGQEPVPGVLVGGIRWLMPVDQALATFPFKPNKFSERPVFNLCFPDRSLIVAVYQWKSFQDRGQPFNLMFLLLDLQRRVVGVQFVDQTASRVLWEPVADGVREPYYDFISIKNNASGSNQVEYQISSAGSGVTLIKTALRSGGRYKENVHWYLAAPFARCLLEIVDNNKRAGMAR